MTRTIAYSSPEESFQADLKWLPFRFSLSSASRSHDAATSRSCARISPFSDDAILRHCCASSRYSTERIRLAAPRDRLRLRLHCYRAVKISNLTRIATKFCRRPGRYLDRADAFVTARGVNSRQGNDSGLLLGGNPVPQDCFRAGAGSGLNRRRRCAIRGPGESAPESDRAA